MTKQLLSKLHNDGDISTHQLRNFYASARAFFQKAASYALSNLPVKDAVLQNAVFVNFKNRESANISQVAFFVTRYTFLYFNVIMHYHTDSPTYCRIHQQTCTC